MVYLKILLFSFLTIINSKAVLHNEQVLSSKPKCSKDNLVSIQRISILNQRKFIVQNMECKDPSCNLDKVEYFVLERKTELIYPANFTVAGTAVNNKNKSKIRSFVVQISRDLRMSDMKRIEFYYGNTTSCYIDITSNEERLIKRIDPAECKQFCEGNEKEILFVYDLSSNNCESGYEGKLRVINENTLELNGFKPRQLNSIGTIAFVASLKVKGEIVDVNLYDENCNIKEVDENLPIQNKQNIRLILRNPFKVHQMIDFGIEEHSYKMKAAKKRICRDRIKPISAEMVKNHEVTTDSSCFV
ncbi:hypothetical protein MHBO_000373 [Bonamia ostreae]|uniref:ZP domain-containing protein n=1 Tax=Bonamia ostreae TaxID=126728 RepID=A0ABV2AG23_9EUKA